MDKEVIIKDLKDKNLWEAFVLQRPESNFLQSFTYGEVNESLGKKVYYLGVYSNQKLIGVCLAIIEDARRGRYLVIPGGPLIDWEDKKITLSLFNHLKQRAKTDKCAFIRLRPQVKDDNTIRRILNGLGLIQSPMHLTAEHTLQLSLNSKLDLLLANMRKNTRYEIKKAMKLGISLKKGTDRKLLDEFCLVQRQTATRQGFVPFPDSLIKAEFEKFAKQDQALIYKASYRNKALAYALIIHYPTESSYHFGASTPLERQYPGAYLVQWEAIRDAWKKAIPRYNFWGIVGDKQKKHRFYGVSIFKRGFGGEEVKYVSSHDLILNWPRYLFVYTLETLRRKLRRLD